MPMVRKISKELAESTPIETDQDAVCTICGYVDQDEDIDNEVSLHTDVYTFDRVLMCIDCAHAQRLVYNEQ